MSVEQEHRFPCEQCGANYRFDPSRALMVCDFCGHEEKIDGGPWRGGALREQDFNAAIAGRVKTEDVAETRISKCPNCAAEVRLDPDVQATECPFCATPVVTDTGAHRYIKPRGVMPFVIDEKQAHAEMNAWMGRLWFAPNGLKKYARKGRKMNGVYVPYWTFDAQTESRYRGEHGTVYYETQTIMRDGKREQIQVPKVRWRRVSGRVSRFFDDVLVLGSRSLPKSFTDALQPWDLSALKPYQPHFLSGFQAEGYTIDLQDAYHEAQAQMERVIDRDVRFDIGGDRQRVHSIETDMSEVTFKHVLLPVWLAAYKYRGKAYRFVVNGQTGRVQGERPWSAGKILIAVVLGLAAAAAIGYAIAVSEQMNNGGAAPPSLDIIRLD